MKGNKDFFSPLLLSWPFCSAMRDEPILFCSNPSINHNRTATKTASSEIGLYKTICHVASPLVAMEPGNDLLSFPTGLGVQWVTYVSRRKLVSPVAPHQLAGVEEGERVSRICT